MSNVELRNKTLELIDQHIQNQGLKKHLLASEALMRALARKLLKDDLPAEALAKAEETWGLAGLVHDLDWEETKDTPERHSLLAAEILEKEGFPAELISAVKIHNHLHGLEPQTLLEKTLYATEEITGLIVACALVTPNKKLNEVTVERVLKKFKEPSFAKGVNREIILKCEPFLGLTLDQLIAIALEAMQGIGDELGL